MSLYPYLSDKICKECGGSITIKQKRDRNNEFCSKECYNKYRRVSRPIKVNLKHGSICRKCGITFVPTRNTLGMYCSYACSNGAKAVDHKLICQCCGKEFSIKNIAEIKRGHYKFCSNECRKRKYRINEKFFDKIDCEQAYWMGYIWSTVKYDKYNKLSLIDKNKEMLESFLSDIDSNYSIKKYGKRFILSIVSLPIMKRLSDYGLRSDIYSEFPEIPNEYIKDFIRGYFDSNNGFLYKDMGNNIVSLHGKSSKLMRYMSDYLNGKFVAKNNEWVVVSFDFENKINGLPRLESKWMKF